MVIVTVGLFIFVNAAAGWIWSFTIKDFPNPFPDGAIEAGRGQRWGIRRSGIIAVVGVVMGLLYLLFQHTKVGLGMRAVATNPASARLVGHPGGLDARARLGAGRHGRRGVGRAGRPRCCSWSPT